MSLKIENKKWYCKKCGITKTIISVSEICVCGGVDKENDSNWDWWSQKEIKMFERIKKLNRIIK